MVLSRVWHHSRIVPKITSASLASLTFFLNLPSSIYRWSAVAGGAWERLQGDEAGQTQVDNPNDGEMAKWSHPIGTQQCRFNMFLILTRSVNRADESADRTANAIRACPFSVFPVLPVLPVFLVFLCVAFITGLYHIPCPC